MRNIELLICEFLPNYVEYEKYYLGRPSKMAGQSAATPKIHIPRLTRRCRSYHPFLLSSQVNCCDRLVVPGRSRILYGVFIVKLGLNGCLNSPSAKSKVAGGIQGISNAL